MSIQEPDTPDVVLVCKAGATIIRRILDNEGTDAEDLLRLAAYLRVLRRLMDSIEVDDGSE
jgi:hypothetical protein